MLGGGKKIGVNAAAPTLLCRQLPGGRHDQVLFLNNGTVAVYIADGTVTPAYGYPVEPLGTLALPGDTDWYGIADPAAGNVAQVVNVIPGGLAATPSAAQIALQIAGQNLGVNVTNQPGVNVTNPSIPSRPVLKFSANKVLSASGSSVVNSAPGVGQTFFLYLVYINLLQIGGAAGVVSAALEDTNGRILYEVATIQNIPPSPVDFDGFQVGDNLGLQFVASFTAGGTTNFAQVGYNYSVGATQ